MVLFYPDIYFPTTAAWEFKRRSYEKVTSKHMNNGPCLGEKYLSAPEISDSRKTP